MNPIAFGLFSPNGQAELCGGGIVRDTLHT
jgi:hypothetical protein